MDPYIYRPLDQSANDIQAVILSTSIGGQYFLDWDKFARHTWEWYAKTHRLGILVYSDSVVTRDHPAWLLER